jgi:hypothetical protein
VTQPLARVGQAKADLADPIQHALALDVSHRGPIVPYARV